MEHPRKKSLVLPRVRPGGDADPPEPPKPPEPPRIYPCPCCGCRTYSVPPAEDIAYICPVCLWENDVFIYSEDEPSDENHGLTLRQGRENVRLHGVCDPRLIRYARPPRPSELPEPEAPPGKDGRPL